MQTYTLSKPFTIDGKELKELRLDLDDLSYTDIKAIYTEHATRVQNDANYDNKDLPVLLVARASGVIFDDLRANLCGTDALRLMARAGSFFSDMV